MAGILIKGIPKLAKKGFKKATEFSYGPRHYSGSMPKTGGKQGVLFTEKTGSKTGTKVSKETTEKRIKSYKKSIEEKKMKKQELSDLGRLGDRRYKITKGSRWNKDK